MERVKFTEVFEDATKYGRKIPTDGYLAEGKYPIIDQGQNQIAGYTNEEFGLFRNIPVIIFGDHTRIIKFVNTPFFLGADGVKVLKPVISNVDYKYLYYSLLNVKIPDTGYNRHFKWLKESEIPLPTLEEQKAIAGRLDKVSGLIEKRKAQLEKLDLLIKSRFIELFGSCGTYELLQDSNIYISDGNYSSKYPTADEFVEEGVPFIRASNMEMNTIVDNNMYFITKEKHAILLKGHVKAGDVLITTRGATIGKIACVPPRHEDSNINAQIVLLRCPKNEYNPLFLSWYLKLDNTQVEIQKLISGSAQPQLPIKRLVQLKLLKPDINLQNQFAAFVEQTDKSKFEIQKSLEKLEILKKSLMQKYFG